MKRPVSPSPWELYYKRERTASTQFAEIRQANEGFVLKSGAIFTGGDIQRIDSIDEAHKRLIDEGFTLERDWVFDLPKRDMSVLKNELYQAVTMDPNFGSSNALALVTDNDVMTITVALHKFDSIEDTKDDQLWIVDEWSEWSDYWLSDISYRWLLAYGQDAAPELDEFVVFRNDAFEVFRSVIRECRPSIELGLIYIGGDDLGHRESLSVLPEKLANRLAAWLGIK